MGNPKSLMNLGHVLIIVGLIMTTIQFIFDFIINFQLFSSDGGNTVSNPPPLVSRGFDFGTGGANIGIETTYVGVLVILIGVILIGVVHLSEKLWPQKQKTITLRNGDIEATTVGIDDAEMIAAVLKEISQLDKNGHQKIFLNNGNLEITVDGPFDINTIAETLEEFNRLGTN